MVLLTLITVVKDDPGLSSTIQSVDSLCANNEAVEHLILDSSCPPISLPQRIFRRVFHEEPAGIYHAMENARRRARGLYVVYVNSGDTVENEGFEEALRILRRDRPVWLSCLVAHKANGICRVEAPMPWGLIKLGEHPISHQAMIHRADKGAFDLRYRCVADLVQMDDLYSEGGEPRYIPLTLVTCAPMTVAKQRKNQQRLEVYRFIISRYGLFPCIMRVMISIFGFKKIFDPAKAIKDFKFK